MDSDLSLLVAILVLFLGAFVRSAVGFGDAVLAMPLLTMTLGVHTATPLVALTATSIAGILLWREWNNSDLGAAGRLIASSLVGIPFGLLFLKTAPAVVLHGVLGVALVLFGINDLLNSPWPRSTRESFAYPFGFVAGLLGGAYNTNGPPVVLYATLRRWKPVRFRATLQGYFLPTGLLIIVGHGLAGLWTPTVLKLYLAALPGVVLAIYLGAKASQLLSRTHFRRVVGGLLILLGAALFL